MTSKWHQQSILLTLENQQLWAKSRRNKPRKKPWPIPWLWVAGMAMGICNWRLEADPREERWIHGRQQRRLAPGCGGGLAACPPEWGDGGLAPWVRRPPGYLPPGCGGGGGLAPRCGSGLPPGARTLGATASHGLGAAAVARWSACVPSGVPDCLCGRAEAGVRLLRWSHVGARK
jgi:hypothetical protein